MAYATDSPLSITASVAGILTFLAAILAALYVRLTYLRNADTEYFQVKASLSWYKTESTFMSDLIQAADSGDNGGKEKEMYGFVMEQLGRLEERLLECLAEAEEGVGAEVNEKPVARRWTTVPRGLAGKSGVAMSWMGVRGKALELVRQRDALGSRVLFAQMSLISSRVKDQEARMRRREERQRERMERLEGMVIAQNEKLDKLQDLVYRVMHRDRLNFEAEDEGSPKYEELPLNTSRPSQPEGDYSTTQHQSGDTALQPALDTNLYPIPAT